MRRIALNGLALALVLGPATHLAGAEEEVVQEVRVEIGQQAPDFLLPTTDGHTLSRESLEGDKPLVLTFFRGTW
jgi:hypothetical protein